MKKSLLTLGLALVVLTSSYAQRRQRTEEELKPTVKATAALALVPEAAVDIEDLEQIPTVCIYYR